MNSLFSTFVCGYGVTHGFKFLPDFPAVMGWNWDCELHKPFLPYSCLSPGGLSQQLEMKLKEPTYRQ